MARRFNFLFNVLLAFGLISIAGNYDASMVLGQTGGVEHVANEKSSDEKGTEVKHRSFNFVYGAALTDLKPGTKVKVWLPLATSGPEQEVQLLSTNLPAPHRLTKETKYGNELIYLEAEANSDGEVPLEVTYHITRHELTNANYQTENENGERHLGSSSLVPVDDKLRKVLFGEKKFKGEPLDIAKQLYEGVEQHMKYDKPEDNPGWGRGDAEWACNAALGNCTDFHSLFISSARNLKIPAKFEIGFPIPDEIGKGKVGGYHCWAKFLSGQKWIPVDISEADKHPEMKDYYFGNLTENRVLFSVGRDLELQPRPDGGLVNYLVYPYAEVDGEQHRSFRKAFRYEDDQ